MEPDLENLALHQPVADALESSQLGLTTPEGLVYLRQAGRETGCRIDQVAYQGWGVGDSHPPVLGLTNWGRGAQGVAEGSTWT